MSSILYRRNIPLLIIFVVGVIVSSKMYLNIPGLPGAEGFLTKMGTIIAAFAVIVGSLTLMIRHAGIAIKRPTREWPLSVYLILLTVVFLVVGVGYGSESPEYLYIYNMIIINLTTAMWGVTGIFCFTAAVRAMRIRNVDGGLLMIFCVIVIIANMPIGDVLWAGFSPLKTWILSFPATAGNRGFIIGAAIGATVLGLRTILGLERGWIGER